MAIPISSLESVIEVKMGDAIANLRAFDAAEKQVAQSAEQSGAAITKAFSSTAQPIQSAAKDVNNFGASLKQTQSLSSQFAAAVKADFAGASRESQGFGARLRELVISAKEFAGGFLSGALQEVKEQFGVTSNSATATGAAIKQGADAGAKSLQSITQQARGLGGVIGELQPAVAAFSASAFKELGARIPVIGSLVQAVGKEFDKLATAKLPNVSAEAQSFKILAGAVAASGKETSVTTSLIKDFRGAVAQAAAGNQALAGTFQKLGVDIVGGLKNPAQAFSQFVKGFSSLSGAEKDAASLAVFGQNAATATPLIEGMGSAMSGLGAEAAGAGAALGPVGLAIGAVVAVAVAAVAAVTAVGKVFIGLAQEGADLGGKMLDLSNNTGIATEALSLYKIEAEKSGSTLEAVTGGIEKFERKLEDAASGEKKSAELLKAFGIDAKTAAENPQAAFDKLAVSIASIEDPALRVKVATELFGKSGANLISTFITMQEEGDGLKTRMAELGLTLSKDVAEGADSVGDEFVILTAVSDSLKIKVANEMGPQLVEALQAIEGAAAAITPVVVELTGAFAKMFTATVNGARVPQHMHFKPEILGGIEEEACRDMLQDFFKTLR